jgi:hypothetical protein
MSVIRSQASTDYFAVNCSLVTRVTGLGEIFSRPAIVYFGQIFLKITQVAEHFGLLLS